MAAMTRWPRVVAVSFKLLGVRSGAGSRYDQSSGGFPRGASSAFHPPGSRIQLAPGVRPRPPSETDATILRALLVAPLFASIKASCRRNWLDRSTGSRPAVSGGVSGGGGWAAATCVTASLSRKKTNSPPASLATCMGPMRMCWPVSALTRSLMAVPRSEAENTGLSPCFQVIEHLLRENAVPAPTVQHRFEVTAGNKVARWGPRVPRLYHCILRVRRLVSAAAKEGAAVAGIGHDQYMPCV